MTARDNGQLPRLVERARHFTELALGGTWPGTVQHSAHYDTCPACEPVRVAQALADVAEAVDRACRAVCRDNLPETVGAEDVDETAGRFVCLNENGDPLIDTDEPAEVVTELARLWGAVSERLETREAELEAVRRDSERQWWRLAVFARRILEAVQEGADVEAEDAQAWAVKAGLLVVETRVAPCDPEACACAEFGFPISCYRFTDILTGAG